MLSCAALLFARCGSARRTATPPSSSTDEHLPVHAPASARDDARGSTSGDAPSQPTCIFNVDEEIIVLDLQSNAESDDLRIHALVTGAIRDEVKKSSLRLSAYRGWTLDERLTGGCTAPLRFFHASARLDEDAACMTKVAHNLRSTWLLSGFVDATAGGYVVDAQLVSNDHPAAARSIRFTFAGNTDLPAAAHRAWVKLTSTTEVQPGSTSRAINALPFTR